MALETKEKFGTGIYTSDPVIYFLGLLTAWRLTEVRERGLLVTSPYKVFLLHLQIYIFCNIQPLNFILNFLTLLSTMILKSRQSPKVFKYRGIREIKLLTMKSKTSMKSNAQRKHCQSCFDKTFDIDRA